VVRPDDLERDLPPQRGLFRAVDDAHAARAELVEQTEIAEPAGRLPIVQHAAAQQQIDPAAQGGRVARVRGTQRVEDLRSVLRPPGGALLHQVIECRAVVGSRVHGDPIIARAGLRGAVFSAPSDGVQALARPQRAPALGSIEPSSGGLRAVSRARRAVAVASGRTALRGGAPSTSPGRAAGFPRLTLPAAENAMAGAGARDTPPALGVC